MAWRALLLYNNDATLRRGIRTRKECRAMLGKNFRVVSGLPARCTDDEVCDWLLRRYVFVHLDNNRDKFNLLVYVT
jgi:DNA-directed RNA polymerase I subunit RPA2